MLIFNQQRASRCAHSAQIESRANFVWNGIRASKQPLVALIIAGKSFR